ncbi:type II secretion system F family protein [Gephyromycinifex aptenodytis]|uniref:type II secretion system F family protein n=1 Tax=Gephyromycinifex aptenodytis TaxID=2716227 RepID=UPI0014453492|nr:type II secretion system F family protein [Gephyromycinifex aptenodytis]
MSLLVVLAVLLWPARRSPPLGRSAAPPSLLVGLAGGRSWSSVLTSVRSAASAGSPAAPEHDVADALIDLVDSLAPALSAGLPAQRALELVLGGAEPVRPEPGGDAATAGVQLRARLAERLAAGDSVGTAFQSLAADTDSDGARLLAQAWLLSEETGAPLAATSACAVRLLRSRRDQERAAEVALAGARITIRVLTILPVGGPLLAVLLGVDPVQAYLRSPAVWGCLALATVLVLLGRSWVARQVSRVAGGPVLDPGPGGA